MKWIDCLRIMKRESVTYYLDGLTSRDRGVLSKCISLVESQSPSDQHLAWQILIGLPEREVCLRLAVSGTPGVGKSTFIESAGKEFVSRGAKLAVLAVDPSSSLEGGSILGDKTRMTNLSIHPDAFVRPSANLNHAGGVGASTYQSILLCEAAGFDHIIIETVGVGQSEIMVRDMVDFFLLLIQPASGDELQGIKRGIMEIVDGISINKADGALNAEANKTKNQLDEALKYRVKDEPVRSPWVRTCSALENTGVDEVICAVLSDWRNWNEGVQLSRQRARQEEKMLYYFMEQSLLKFVQSQSQVTKEMQKQIEVLADHKHSLTTAQYEFQKWLDRLKLKD